MTPANLPPVNFSKTQRLVLLIDLHPLLTLQNPTAYLRAVTSVAARLLQFAPLSASLSAYKLFFSSLSPLRSDAVLPRHLSTPSLSFNLPAQTLASLSITFDSISTIIDLPNSPCSARASNAVSSLLQLIHDYSWETEKDNLLGEDDCNDGDFVKVPSNLVILLSAIGQSVSCSVDFWELREFDEVFCVVKEAFVIRDIHLCWIDVKIEELKFEGVYEKKNERENNLVILKDGIRKIGWGFCSSELIVLGSALLPFGLIYPKIGVSVGFMDFGGLNKKTYSGELSLEILDVNGMPLECKCCDLEFVNLKSLPCSNRTDDILNAAESRDSQSFHGQDAFWIRLAKENMKVHVKSVHRYDDCERIGGSSEIVLVRECFLEQRKNKKNSGVDFFADRVLEMLHGEMGGVTSRSQPPTWQMFLSFLHTKGYWALVSLSSSNRDIFMGILKPFTTHLALICILDADHVSSRGKSGSKLPKIENKTRDTCDEDMSNSNRCLGSQTDTSTSDNCEPRGDGKRKKSLRRLYQEMTWNSFYKAAFEGSDIDLFELYIARHSEKSKKLKFLKCWMKQITKLDPYCLTTLPGSKSIEELSACNAFLSEPSPAKEGASPVLKPETSETFFNSLSKRIQHSLESGMDLKNLAERVVKSSIHWLHHNCDENSSEGQQPMRNLDDSSKEAVGSKLIELLLKAPKEMKKMHQDSDQCSSSENIVREYELQILLRIEILRSAASEMMGESRKQKLLKQICSLLEIIQYLVAGGIHGHISLYDYVERTIRARYADELEDFVKKIYTEMDLLPFGDVDDETPSLLFNSEDSNQSWKDKYDRNEKTEANSIHLSFSTEGNSSQPLANHCESPQDIGKDEHTRILNEARERRERARRFAPFISKARDLQRVWAPKQPKALKGKLDSLPNKSKGKDRQTPTYSVVCETPMTGNKRACSGDKARKDLVSSSYSVSKALFQDD
ncbi:uncharacterized protein LOC105160401 [Sesamum indicum]|uniref:Uncharacterized protein LOC105160401 n=1 Tax=Sesamum indicum TaxID=4182 RepID=A0A6I9T241_SESIN|nr:uncharacterized protein LOC105160401 [Sesamum indicum]